MILLTQTIMAAEAAAQDTISVISEQTAESINVWELAVKGGWIMIVLALLSVIGIYIFFERFYTLQKALKHTPQFMERIHDNIKDNDLKSAANYCNYENTPLARVIEKGIKNMRYPISSLRESIDNCANLEIAALEKGLPILSTIAAIAPMIGFLGTVTGMVQAFWEMANAGNNIDVSLLSSGIYEAMITTVGGLIVGIVSTFAYNYLVTLTDKVQNDMEEKIISFMEIVHEKKEQQ